MADGEANSVIVPDAPTIPERISARFTKLFGQPNDVVRALVALAAIGFLFYIDWLVGKKESLGSSAPDAIIALAGGATAYIFATDHTPFLKGFISLAYVAFAGLLFIQFNWCPGEIVTTIGLIGVNYFPKKLLLPSAP